MSSETLTPQKPDTSAQPADRLLRPDDLRDWFLQHAGAISVDTKQTAGSEWSEHFRHLREQALQNLANVNFPGRKTESWRYTSIQPLIAAINALSVESTALSADKLATQAEEPTSQQSIDGADEDQAEAAHTDKVAALIDQADLIIRLDGDGLSSLQSTSEEATNLFSATLRQDAAGHSTSMAEYSQLSASGTSKDVGTSGMIGVYGDRVPIGYYPFVDLNTAFLSNYLEIDCVAADAETTAPTQERVLKILLLNETTGSSGDRSDFLFQNHSRVLLKLGRFARVELTEVLTDAAAGSEAEQRNGTFDSLVLEASLDDSSVLHHYRFSAVAAQHSSYSAGFVKLGRDARYLFNGQSTGSALCRTDLTVNLAASGAYAAINATMLLSGERRCDYHTCLEHSAAHAESDEQVRSLVDDSARAVFNGRIYIHPHAQKTRAEMNNRNLLMSPKAEVDTKPELEIYADDVLCAHGATIGQLDAGAVFYCKSRGIDEQDARALLSEAFIVETINLMPGQAQQNLALGILKEFQKR